MPNGWHERRLDDCGIWLSGGTPRKSEPDFWGGEIPWVGPKDLHVRYIDDAEEHVTPTGAASGSRLAPRDSVLIVVRSMALAKRLQIGLTGRQVAFNQDVKAIIPADGVLPRFLFYALWGHHDDLHQLVDEASHGTKRLRTEVLARYSIPIPPAHEQKRIVAVLGALDDKIESNHRLASLLQQLAATVFRARFVDFLGVEERWDSGVGRIPRGWHAKPFTDVVEINPRVRLPKGASAPFIAMSTLAPWAVRPNDIDERPYSGGARFEPGDTLMARITGCIEHGKGAFIDFLDGPGSGSTEFLVLRAKPPLTPEAVFLLSRDERVRSHAMAHMTGSSGRQRVPTGCFKELKIAVPSDYETWHDVAEVLRTTFAQARCLWEESRSLAGIRDALLPKLVSGEIRVPDAADPDEVIGQVAEVVAA